MDNRVPVTVLQHQRERFHPFGSARLLQLALRRCDLHVVHRTGGKEVACDLDLPVGTGLLYPHRDARPLTELDRAERPSQLLLLDGTWSQAHRLYRDNPWLHALPHVSLGPTAPSLYRVRREPKPHCLSTLEAAVRALGLLEPETEGLEGLLSLFVRMNDEQVARRRAAVAAPRRKRARKRPSRAVPEVVRCAPERLVVVYGESAQLHTRTCPRALVPLQWAAVRLDRSATFERFVAPQRGEVTAEHLRCMGLHTGHLAGAGTLASLRAAWRGFLRPGDVVAAWNASTLRMHEQLDPERGGSILLKRVYTNLRRHRAGMLEDALAREGVEAEALPHAGRAGRRLANALAMAEWLGDPSRGGTYRDA